MATKLTVIETAFEVEFYDADSGINVVLDKITVGANSVDEAVKKARQYARATFQDTIADVRSVRYLPQQTIIN